MSALDPARVNEGLVGIRRNDSTQTGLPSRSQAVVSGGPIERHVEAIYGGDTMEDVARGLTRPHIDDQTFAGRGSHSAMLANHSARVERECALAGDQATDVVRAAQRTLKTLSDLDLVITHDFGDNRTRYEIKKEDHHDHLICVASGEVIEFRDPELERLKKKIAKRLGYELESHSLELYGRPKS